MMCVQGTSVNELPKDSNILKAMVTASQMSEPAKEQDEMKAMWVDFAKGQFIERGDVSVNVNTEILCFKRR